MLKKSKNIVAVILALVFIIPATGLSISKHSCMDCGDIHLSLIYHHNDCHDHSSEKNDENNWHFHFFDKHNEHKKECQYEVIKLEGPYKGPDNFTNLFSLEFVKYNISAWQELFNSEKESVIIPITENIKIPDKNILQAYCILLI